MPWEKTATVPFGCASAILAHAVADLGKALAAVDVPFLRIVAEIGELFRVDALKLGPGCVLPIADVDLAQGADGAQRQAVRFIDGKRRNHRAEAVA